MVPLLDMFWKDNPNMLHISYLSFDEITRKAFRMCLVSIMDKAGATDMTEKCSCLLKK